MSELLPCPFCGGSAERIDIDDGENAGGSCISCTRCQASSNLEFGYKENFVSNWNRRAGQAMTPDNLREAVADESIPEVWRLGTARLVSGWRDGESRALAIAVMALRSIESQEPDTHELTLAHMMAQSAREALTLIQEVMEP